MDILLLRRHKSRIGFSHPLWYIGSRLIPVLLWHRSFFQRELKDHIGFGVVALFSRNIFYLILCTIIQTALIKRRIVYFVHTIYCNRERAIFLFIRIGCNSVDIIRIRIRADDRQQIASALDRQRACAAFQLLCADRALLREVKRMTAFCVTAYLPDLFCKFVPCFGFIAASDAFSIAFLTSGSSKFSVQSLPFSTA